MFINVLVWFFLSLVDIDPPDILKSFLWINWFLASYRFSSTLISVLLLYIGGQIFLALLRNLARIIPGTSIVDSSDLIDRDPIHVSQDVANHSFPAPAPVVVRDTW